MNDPIDWSTDDRNNDQQWRDYFQLLLANIKDSVAHEFNDLSVFPYDDPRDFVNGFTLAGAFFSGLHLEANPVARQKQIASFRKTLALYLVSIINELEHSES